MSASTLWRASRTAAMALVLAAFAAACLRQRAPDVWACRDDNDCEAAEEHCIQDGEHRYCRPEGYCANDLECGPGLGCVESKCRAVECSGTDSSFCGPYPCVQHRCLHSCNHDAVCGGLSRCRDGVCLTQCDASTVGRDCDGQVCTRGACETSCSGSAQCAPGFECRSSGRCRLPDQGGGVACDPERDSALTCGGYACQNGACATDCTNTPCARGYGCSFGSCVEILSGAACAADADCGPHDRCCTANSASEGVCLGACATLPVDTSCIWDAECQTGYCYMHSRCLPAPCSAKECGTDLGVDCGSCPGDLVCSDNLCRAPVCLPETPFCDGNSVAFCIDGFKVRAVYDCREHEHCSASDVLCRPYACQPNEGFCDHELFRPCDANGEWTRASSNCANQSLTCSPVGCGVTIEESVAAAGAAPIPASRCGNVYGVDTQISLRTFTQALASHETELIWLVSRATTIEGPYETVLRLPRGPPGEELPGVPRSPILNVLLRPGSFYFLGVETVSAVFELDTAATEGELSFGRTVVGGCSDFGIFSSPEFRATGTVPQTLELVRASAP